MRLPDRTVLDNGAVLVSQAVPANPFIAFRGSVPSGMAAEARDEFGVAEFTARLLRSGTRRWSAAKVADRLERIGSSLEFVNLEEAIAFHGRCTRETARETIRISSECLGEPAFPPKEVERIRTAILNDLRQEADDTHERAARELSRILFRDHAYGRDPKASPERARRIRRSDIASFHESHVGPEGLILAVTGDVDRDLVEDAIAAPLSRLDGGGNATHSIPMPVARRPHTRRIPMPHKSQVDVMIGLPAASRRHADYYALNLANLLFGRIGLYGRLGKRIRDDEGLAYYAYSALDARSVGGDWTISAGVNPTNLEKAVHGIRVEMDRLRSDPFSHQEIRDGKDNQLGGLVVSLERNAEVAAELHRMEYFDLGMDFLERYAGIVEDLSEDRVRDVARKYFDPGAASMVVAGPIGKHRPAL